MGPPATLEDVGSMGMELDGIIGKKYPMGECD